jgi:signal transduction histidine kinase/CheY-like chemotaxis protein
LDGRLDVTSFVAPRALAPLFARFGRRLVVHRADGLTERVRVEQIDLLFKNVAFGVVGAAIGGVAIAVSLVKLDATGPVKAIYWASYLFVGMAAHLALLYRYKKRSPESSASWRRWAIGFAAIAFLEGLGWGWAPVWLVDSERADLRLLVISCTMVVAAASISAFGSYLPVFFAFYLPANLPMTVALAFERDRTLHFAAYLALICIITVTMIAFQASGKFRELVALRIKSADLAEQLRSQIELVEQAMIAKSNFLAAASHDLRQPVHAIALFAGALRELPLTEAAQRLMGQIENSVVALDGLFAALLDISRLDANSIEVRRSVFAITPLVARIVQDFTAEASAKGVHIEHVASGARVYADPILLERILRNLVSNAVRYTPEGRVLVGCRRRREGVEVQVCDTGLGIAPAHRDLIFKEYFQLNNPERDRQKGLGLGLAIVQRLGRLLEAPLSLRSQPGRGSCFGVLVPLAGSAPFDAPLQTALPTPRGSGLIVIVDDEAPILTGMTALLQSWGFQVTGASSGGAAIAELTRLPVRPDLLISDHWLRGGETGFDVIDRVRVEYNDDIPAILISGDTGPALLAEAEAAGVVLLHKPTHHGKLRAAIAHSLAVSRQSL